MRRFRLTAFMFALVWIAALAPFAHANSTLDGPFSIRSFIALGDDASGVLVNPGGLARVADRHLHLRIGVPGGGSGSSDDLGTYFAYIANDGPLGTGALSLYSLGSRTEYAYSAGKLSGHNGAVGGNVKYVTEGNARWWSADLGVQHRLADDVSFGLIVRNIVSSRGKTASGGHLNPLPRELGVGIALDNRQGFHVAADYVVPDLANIGADAEFRYGIGLEEGNVRLWAGQRRLLETGDRLISVGLGLTFSSLSLDVSWTQQRQHGYAVMLGVTSSF